MSKPLWFIWDIIERICFPRPKLSINLQRINMEEGQKLRSPEADNLEYRQRVILRMTKGLTMLDMDPLYKGALYNEAKRAAEGHVVAFHAREKK